MSRTRTDRRTIAFTAAAIYGGATVVGLVEMLTPGGENVSPLPGIAALVIAPAIALVGPRLPRLALAMLGPLGTAFIGYALATTTGHNDGAMLYVWPALWMSYFFGMSGTVAIVLCTAVSDAIALLAMPAAQASVDRWIDVVVAVVVVAGVTRVLAARGDRLVAELSAQARSDALTGLLNRRGFDERYAVERARIDRHGGRLAIVSFDIDFFKTINDEHGHELGDRVLTWVGATIAEHIRATDFAARVGGEEFVVVLPGADEAGALATAERVRTAVGNAEGSARLGVAPGIGVTVSAGVAAATAPMDVAELLGRADAMLYRAKQTGRDRTVCAATA